MIIYTKKTRVRFFNMGFGLNKFVKFVAWALFIYYFFKQKFLSINQVF